MIRRRANWDPNAHAIRSGRLTPNGPLVSRPHPNPRAPRTHSPLTSFPRASSYCQWSSREGAWEGQRVHLRPPLILLSPTSDTVQTYSLNCRTGLCPRGWGWLALRSPPAQSFPAERPRPPHPSPVHPGPALTLLEHAHPQALGEATGLAGLASPLGDLALVGGRTAVLDAPCQEEAGLQWRPPRARRGPRRRESPDSPRVKCRSGERGSMLSGAGKPGTVRGMASGLGAPD